jgi:hypothetical protein
MFKEIIINKIFLTIPILIVIFLCLYVSCTAVYGNEKNIVCLVALISYLMFKYETSELLCKCKYQ